MLMCLQISPVWYQLRAAESGSGFRITGGHDVDQGWIAKLREPVDQQEGQQQCSGNDDAGGSKTCSAAGEGGTSQVIWSKAVTLQQCVR